MLGALPDGQHAVRTSTSPLTPLALEPECLWVCPSPAQRNSAGAVISVLCFFAFASSSLSPRPAGLQGLPEPPRHEGCVCGSPALGPAAPGRRLTSDGATSPWAQPLSARLSRCTQSGFSPNGTGSCLRQSLSSWPSPVLQLSGPLRREVWGVRPPQRGLLDSAGAPTPARAGESSGAVPGLTSEELQHGQGGLVRVFGKGKR